MLVRMTTASRRVGRLLTLLACAALPGVCLASREVPVFTVNVAAQTPAALAQAMRAVLVRATGHAAAATDPQFAALATNAAQYVQGYQPAPAGGLLVTFKSAPLEQAIRAAGRNLWDADRPFTLVVLSPAPAQSQQGADAAAVQQAAQARGLPISIVPLTVRGSEGRLLPTAALLAMAHNFGGEQLLIGHDTTSAQTDAPPPGGAGATGASAATSAAASAGPAAPAAAAPVDTWRWTLVTPFTTRQFTGAVTAGINQTVALLAPPLQSSPGDAVVKTPVRVTGLQNLDDYARVETMLTAVPGVRRSIVQQVTATAVVFDLWARGGEQGLRHVLALSPRLKAQAGTTALSYRYVPPPAAPPAPAPGRQTGAAGAQAASAAHPAALSL